jgi:hypothetical protein
MESSAVWWTRLSGGEILQLVPLRWLWNIVKNGIGLGINHLPAGAGLFPSAVCFNEFEMRAECNFEIMFLFQSIFTAYYTVYDHWGYIDDVAFL